MIYINSALCQEVDRKSARRDADKSVLLPNTFDFEAYSVDKFRQSGYYMHARGAERLRSYPSTCEIILA